MGRHILRLVLTAGCFYFLFPLIPGAQFHGNFMHALLAGILFAVIAWIVELAAMAISATLIIATLGMALFVLAPLWLVGFFLLPALVLRFVADTIPSVLWFSGWWPAIWGGLVMLFVGVVTSCDLHVRMRSNRSHA
ncbi:MAG: hypothetical protein DKT66_05450 [Candidatus Melainabacteria bacterium]|nr:MAG: hypothetical protein DKT66_05450 [Candidatus Melainabacteria bacterium]